MRKFKLPALLLLAGVLLALAGVTALAEDKKEEKKKKPEREPDVIFVPTPQAVVDKMLELAAPKKTDILNDLGCGDGIIVLTAARKYGCKSTGYDINPERIEDCEKNLAKEKEDVKKLVKFEEKDIFKLDLSEVNVVTLYLLPSLNVKLVPQLKKMKAGSRIVSHDFNMEGYKPDKVVEVDGPSRKHTVYLWTIPLKPEKE